MRKMFRIARREYKASVRTKGFIIGLVLAPILMSGGFLAIKLLENQVDTTDRRVVVVDRSGMIAEALVIAAEARNTAEVYDEQTGKKVKPAYLFEVVEPNTTDPKTQQLELSNQIRNGKLYAFVEIGKGILHPRDDPSASRITYHAENAALDDLRRWIARPINNHLRRLRLAEANIDESTVKDLFHWMPVESMGLVSVDEETGKVKEAQHSSEAEAILIPLIMMMLMFMMIMMGASPLLNAVMDEKSQRIAEVLLGSVKPFQFMMGKLLSGVGVSLTGATVYIIGGIFAVRHMGFGHYIPYHILPWFFAYVVMAILMLGALGAALGSACNDAKDVQSLTFPAMMPAMIPMFIMMPVLKEPLSSFSTWVSLFPLFTPTLMLLRQSTPAVLPMWQPWVALLGVLVFTVLFVWAGGRIFRVGILMQGKPPRLMDILRWAIRG